MKRKVLVGSLLSALMSLSVIVGGTFALFTSKAETNIAISSGKVEVKANVALTAASSRDVNVEVKENKATFVNGGTVSVSDGLVDFSLLTPGDRAEFTISLTNNSNVATQYRTIVSLISGVELFSALDITINGTKYDGETIYSFWTDAQIGVLEEIDVVVEFPYSNNSQNDLQGLTSKFNFTIEAIQGNADVVNENAILYANNWYSSFADAILAAKDDTNPEFEVYGYVKSETVPYSANTKFIGKNSTATIDFTNNIFASNLTSVAFENLNIKRSNNIYKGYTHTAMETYTNCVIDGVLFVYGQNAKFENCTFNQMSADAYNIWTYAANVDFVNCEFYSAGKSVLIYKEKGTDAKNVNLTDCNFYASLPSAGKAAIEIDSSLNPYVVSINNCNSTGFAAGSVSGNTLWNHKLGSQLTITIDGVTPTEATKANDQTEFEDAVKANDSVVVLGKTTYTLPTATQDKDLTIVGAGKDTILEVTNVSNISSITMENLTIKEDNGIYNGYTHLGKAVYKNCIIEGQFFNYANEIEFINCTFNQTYADSYNIWTYGANDISFIGCEFYSAGKSVLIYNEGSIADPSYSYFENCTFYASAPVTGKAAIEIDSTYNSYVVDIVNCTAFGFAAGSISGNTLWNHKLGSQAVINVK